MIYCITTQLPTVFHCNRAHCTATLASFYRHLSARTICLGSAMGIPKPEDAMHAKPVWRKRLRRYVPISEWIRTYTRRDLVADFIAGLTLGLTMIPQSIAYAALAGLAPQYGLYSTFAGSFIYVFFGTVKEVSIGPTSLMALLTFEFTRDLPYEFIILLTFGAGCVELLMGVMRLGFLVDFISAPVTCGFQSATASIIIVSQLKGLLGLRKFKPGEFVHDLITIVKKLPETRFGDASMGFFCCITLLLLRALKDSSCVKNAGQWFKKSAWFISISRNALIVLISSAVAFSFENVGLSPFLLSGNITSGLPTFQLPQFSTVFGNETYTFPQMVNEIKLGILILPLVAVLANVTIAKAFCGGSAVDAGQEMLTLGACNIVGSFISAMPTCGAFTRSAVSNSSGVRTPLAGLFSGSLILIVLTLLTPYFYYIPRASLSAVLICAVMFMFDYKTMFLLWRANKRDFFCCMTTFLSSLLINVEVGLLVGILINVCQLLYLWARPTISITIEDTGAGTYYLVRPDVGLFFPAVDFLRSELQKHCPQDLPVVIDCLHFKGIDYTCAQGIREMLREYIARDRKLIFINMSERIHSMLADSRVTIPVRACSYQQEEIRDILFRNNISESPSALLLVEEKELNCRL